MGVVQKAARTFEGMPGLRSKTFIWDPEAGEAVNVYVWDRSSAALGVRTSWHLTGATTALGRRFAARTRW
jgi:hypothetical protein